MPSAEAQMRNYSPTKTICSKQDAADKYIQAEQHKTKKVKHHIVKSHRAKGGKTAKWCQVSSSINTQKYNILLIFKSDMGWEFSDDIWATTHPFHKISSCCLKVICAINTNCTPQYIWKAGKNCHRVSFAYLEKRPSLTHLCSWLLLRDWYATDYPFQQAQLSITSKFSASYISVQKLQIQPTVTSIVLGFTGSGGGSLGTVTVRTPSSQAALIASRSASAGSVYLRMKVPALRSMRMYFTPGTCSSRLRTPLIASTLWLSNSTCINQPRHQAHTLPARLRILIFVSAEMRIFQT